MLFTRCIWLTVTVIEYTIIYFLCKHIQELFNDTLITTNIQRKTTFCWVSDVDHQFFGLVCDISWGLFWHVFPVSIPPWFIMALCLQTKNYSMCFIAVLHERKRRGNPPVCKEMLLWVFILLCLVFVHHRGRSTNVRSVSCLGNKTRKQLNNIVKTVFAFVTYYRCAWFIILQLLTFIR